MRHRCQIAKVTRKRATKSERRFLEYLKALHIPFRSKVKIQGREIDFLIGEKYAVDIDCHAQDPEKNRIVAQSGYIPIHFSNKDITSQSAELWLKSITLKVKQ